MKEKTMAQRQTPRSKQGMYNRKFNKKQVKEKLKENASGFVADRINVDMGDD